MLPVAALLAALVSCHAPSHRPLALALVLESVLDRAGVFLPARLDLASWHLACLAQAWGVRRALREPGLGLALVLLGAAAFAWCLLVPAGAWWGRSWACSLALAVGLELSALSARHGRGAAPTAASRAAAVLVGADAASLLVGLTLGPEALGPPSTVGAAGVAAVESLYLAGLFRRGRDEADAPLASPPATAQRRVDLVVGEHDDRDQDGHDRDEEVAHVIRRPRRR